MMLSKILPESHSHLPGDTHCPFSHPFLQIGLHTCELAGLKPSLHVHTFGLVQIPFVQSSGPQSGMHSVGLYKYDVLNLMSNSHVTRKTDSWLTSVRIHNVLKP